MKSKIPCPPGFVPVAKVDYATGVCAGKVVATREYPPDARRRARFGSSPAASMGSTIFGSSPSRPMTMTFWKWLTRRRSLDWCHFQHGRVEPTAAQRPPAVDEWQRRRFGMDGEIQIPASVQNRGAAHILIAAADTLSEGQSRQVGRKHRDEEVRLRSDVGSS